MLRHTYLTSIKSGVSKNAHTQSKTNPAIPADFVSREAYLALKAKNSGKEGKSQMKNRIFNPPSTGLGAI